MKVEVALIGGSGVGDRLATQGGRRIHIPTPFGCLRGSVIATNGTRTLLLARHAEGHRTPPHAVNYRALAAGCQRLGVARVFATAAVGSLRTDWEPGALVIPDDFVDLTARNQTMYEHGVKHVDFSHPLPLAGHLRATSERAGFDVRTPATYLATNGPRYETPAEIRALATIGDVVGMTSTTEAIAFREAGIEYGLLCVVTNLGAGLQQQSLDHHRDVEPVVKSRLNDLIEILKVAVSDP